MPSAKTYVDVVSSKITKSCIILSSTVSLSWMHGAVVTSRFRNVETTQVDASSIFNVDELYSVFTALTIAFLASAEISDPVEITALPVSSALFELNEIESKVVKKK